MSSKATPAPAPAKAHASSAAAPVMRAEPAKVHVAPGAALFSIAARLQGGSPLPPPLRVRMEHSFGRSFEKVRVHTGGAADSVAREHRAEALTVGHDVAFGAGRFRPGTPVGDHLVAHELAHVAQQSQSGGGHVAQARSVDSLPGEPAEVAAESAAARAVRGEPAHVGGSHPVNGRVMRRALFAPPPPPNPAPLRGMIEAAARPAMLDSPRTREAVREVAAVRPDRVATVVAALTPPEPAPANGEGKAKAQEQTEAAREAAKEAIEEMPQPEEATGEVPDMAGGAAAQAAPAAVAEPASTAATDQKDEAQAQAEGDKAGEEAKSEAGPAEEGGGAGAKDKAPSSPEQDPAFQRVLARGRSVARAQAHNNTAKRKAAEAQAAAAGPPNELQAMAGGNQVGKMAGQEPAPFDKEAFKAALIEKINQIAPGTLQDADEFKKEGSAGQLKGAVVGQVESSKEGAQGPIKQTAEETPDTASVEPKQVTPQPLTEAGPPPPDIGATAAAPKPKTDAEVSLDAGVQSVEARQQEAHITDETLSNSNEPEFTGALDAKNEAKEYAETAPEAYRQDEAGMIQNAEAEAAGTATAETGAMYQTRGEQFSSVQGEQDSTRSSDEGKRVEITDHIQGIYNDTETAVKTRLETLDQDVNTQFDSGSESARQGFEDEVEREKEAWKDRRYSGIDGAALWLRDLFLPLPDEVNQVYQVARQHYIDAMSVVIDGVATTVETGLNEAMAKIKEGRDAVVTYVGSLEGDLRSIGEEAASNIQAQFDKLSDDVKEHERGLVDSLAQKYVDNLKAVDSRIEAMQSEDRGLLGAALDALAGVIDTILQMKDMLLGILAKAADVIDTIIADPIGFLGNLVAGIKAGLSAFMSNIGEHLKNGLMGWLFGAVAAAGITIPESFDLKGLLGLGAQILGLTYANIRSRAVRILGEPVVKAMETAVEIFRILMTEGLSGVWTYIKDMLGNLAETVISGIRDWVAQKVIIGGIMWLLSLLNPASAFVRACKMIIDVVMFFIERGSQIMALVNAILDSIAAIASGAIGAMASAIEGALAKAVPIAISFLASLLGLGGISDVIRTNIEKIQAPVNKAIDWLIQKAVKLLRAIGGLFGGKKKEEEDDTADPEKQAKVQAGLAALHQAEQPKLDQGKISEEEAEDVVAKVRSEHSVFHVLRVVEGDGRWDYYYEASRGKNEPGAKQESTGDGKVTLYGLNPPSEKPPKGAAWQSHHVPQKVMATYFGEVYEVAAKAVGGDLEVKYKARAAVCKTKGSGGASLSAVWLSTKKHAESHGGQLGDLTTLAAKLKAKARFGHQAGFDQPIQPAQRTKGYFQRTDIRAGIEDASGMGDAEVAADMQPVFARVYAGMFTAGYQGVSSALGGEGDWKDSGKLQPLAEDTWGTLKNPAA